jgi:HlyD family secretion protein
MMRNRKAQWVSAGFAATIGMGYVLWQLNPGPAPVAAVAAAQATSDPTPSKSGSPRTRVVVVRPHTGGIQRTSNQPGTIEAFDFAGLFAKISGYLKQQPVDIRDPVEEGQVLAEIDAPEFQQELKHAEAALRQARSQVTLMEARVLTARAEFEAATAAVTQAEADLDKATSYLKFREIQYQRIKNLFKRDSIEERNVDEKEKERDAAQAAENSASAAILTAKAQAAAAEARIAQAQADVEDAQAKVQVSEATVAKARVFVEYTRIVSPYKGIVTKRNFHVGDFIRAAGQGGDIPLLTVARTDLMRVVVQVPERDVPYTDPGDPAVVELDAISGKKFHGTVSRIAGSEDRVTRSMRTEIDLKNSGNRLRDGMFGRVTIYLDKATSGVTVPSSCLVGDAKKKKFSVFVARNGKAQLEPVEIGHDDGVRVEILSGLAAKDLVVVRPGSDLANGTAVETEEAADAPAEKPGRE